MRPKSKFLLKGLSLIGGLFALTVNFSHPVTAASCLDAVASFAIRICGDIANSGSNTMVDATGNVDANVSNIIRRIVGGANTTINGHVLYDTYTGVIRDQLGPAQFNVIDCRQKMVTVAVAQVCSSSQSAIPKEINQGYLVPDQLASPKNWCTQAAQHSLPSGSLVLYYGSNTAITANYPHKMIAIRGRSLLSMTKDQNNSISINLEVLSDDGRSIVTIENNEFVINSNNYYGMVRPSKSKLIVYDHDQTEVLNVTYLNESSVMITGHFDYAGYAVDIGSEQTTIHRPLPPNIQFAGTCWGANGNADIDLE
jgi:hypothetical protein